MSAALNRAPAWFVAMMSFMILCRPREPWDCPGPALGAKRAIFGACRDKGLPLVVSEGLSDGFA